MPHVPTESDGEHFKEVYARFGLAAHWAQCVEVSLGIFFLFYERINHAELSVQALDAMDADRQRQTLGRLIKDFRKHVDLDSGIEEVLDRALDRRNFLMHHFFHERAMHWVSEDGRSQMIDELIDISADLQYADKLIVMIYKCLGRHLGITDEALSRESAAMQIEAERLFSTASPARSGPPPHAGGTDPAPE
jgi:hypothetical protein